MRAAPGKGYTERYMRSIELVIYNNNAYRVRLPITLCVVLEQTLYKLYTNAHGINFHIYRRISIKDLCTYTHI